MKRKFEKEEIENMRLSDDSLVGLAGRGWVRSVPHEIGKGVRLVLVAHRQLHRLYGRYVRPDAVDLIARGARHVTCRLALRR